MIVCLAKYISIYNLGILWPMGSLHLNYMEKFNLVLILLLTFNLVLYEKIQFVFIFHIHGKILPHIFKFINFILLQLLYLYFNFGYNITCIRKNILSTNKSECFEHLLYIHVQKNLTIIF